MRERKEGLGLRRAPDAGAGHSPRLETLQLPSCGRRKLTAAPRPPPGTVPAGPSRPRSGPARPPRPPRKPRLPGSRRDPSPRLRSVARDPDRNRAAGREPRLSGRRAPRGVCKGLGCARARAPAMRPRAPPPRCSPFWARFGRRRSRPPRPAPGARGRGPRAAAPAALLEEHRLLVSSARGHRGLGGPTSQRLPAARSSPTRASGSPLSQLERAPRVRGPRLLLPFGTALRWGAPLCLLALCHASTAAAAVFQLSSCPCRQGLGPRGAWSPPGV